jgi:hypothetical protein
MNDEQRYLAYMVRLWTVRRNGGRLWRASVEDVRTGERQAFADVSGLVAFLQATMAEGPPAAVAANEAAFEQLMDL